MIFGQDRNEIRRMYSDAWKKHSEGLPMTPLELQIATVIDLHPEYHDDVTADDLDKDYTPDGGKTNPFLHMGLHLSIQEQVATNRPPGIASALTSLTKKCGDAHAAVGDADVHAPRIGHCQGGGNMTACKTMFGSALLAVLPMSAPPGDEVDAQAW